MKVKIIKDYKFLKADSIINVETSKGVALIKKGFARPEPELKRWRIGDLYVAEVVIPTIFMGEIKSVQPEKTRIFTYCCHKEGLPISLGIQSYEYGYDVYKHALTETNYITANRYYSMYSKEFDLNSFINEYNKCISKFGSVFTELMLNKGWTENTYLTREQIEECEKMLNKENIKNDNEREC